MRYFSMLKGLSVAMLFLFFAISLEAKNPKLDFKLPNDSFTVPLKEKIISFIKQIHQNELSDTNFIMIEEPYSWGCYRII